MKHSIRSPWAAFLHDLLTIPITWLMAFWLRFNLSSIPEDSLTVALKVLPILMVVQGSVFLFFGLYRGVWRFASIPDLARISKAVLVGSILSAVAIFLMTRMQGIPRSVFPLYAMLLFGFLGAPRFLYRLSKDYKFKLMPGNRVLIVGAGRAGEMLVRDLLRQSDWQYLPIAFVDDDPKKLGKEIHDIRVLGMSKDIEWLVEEQEIDVIMIALPSVDAKRMRLIVEECERSQIPFRIVPNVQDLLSGKTSVSELRKVSVEDLLGREQVQLDWASISAGVIGKRIFVTGGGGSIGSELCRQIGRLAPDCLVVIDQSEFNLYSIEMELKGMFPSLDMRFHLIDVSDKIAVDRLFDLYKPQSVFHAAAYKHVPLLQEQVREAVANNILGTRCVALAADKNNVESFVLISTDKAVNPTNIMGTTKRIGEIFCQNLDTRSDTHFITVRFGNVLGSAGSVVPLFTRQIQEGGPVTVTHPEVIRYFMTIPEACQLIMQAASNGRGGEIFVLDMGEPVKIAYLAEQMIRLSGKIPGQDIEITYVGLRPGEKLFEELVHENEPLSTTSHDRILLARFREVDWLQMSAVFASMEKACDTYAESELRALMRQLVPEFTEGSSGKREKAEVVHLHPSGKTA